VSEHRRELRRLIDGAKGTQAIYVAVTLGVPDLLAAGPRPANELAEQTGANEDALYRLLRALAALGVLHEGADRTFSLTPVGEPLTSDAPDSIAGWAGFVGRDYHWNAWGSLLHSIRTGENAMRHVLGHDSWTHRERNPEEGVIFDRAMTDLTRSLIPAIVSSYDFTRFGLVADIGGGHGALLAAILRDAPAARGILFDQAHVLAGARSTLEREGVADRCEIVPGSFFESVPAGADAYVLKSIIHDWSDEESVRILRACREAMPEHGRVVLVERDLGGPNESPEAKLSDLNMLVGPGGRERTTDEYAALFASAELRFVGATPTPAGFSLFEAEPV
jgi:hypothetical protein